MKSSMGCTIYWEVLENTWVVWLAINSNNGEIELFKKFYFPPDIGSCLSNFFVNSTSCTFNKKKNTKLTLQNFNNYKITYKNLNSRV